MSLFIEKLGKKGAKKILGRPVAIIQEKASGKPVGFLKCMETLEGGEELVELPSDLEFKMCPETRENLVNSLFITGPAGSGKSTICADYLKAFDQIFDVEPEYKIIISADNIDDPAFEGIPHLRICVDDEFAENPLTLDDLTNKTGSKKSVVVFDDIEGIVDKKRLKALEGLVESCLTCGRKRGINTLFISHRSANGKQTRMILTELNGVVWFPQLGTSRNLTYMLTHHLSIPEEMRNYLKNSDWGRNITLLTSVPQMLLGQHRAAIYNHDDVSATFKKKSIIDKKRAQMDAQEMLGLR
jgi:hypothetical protein